MTTASPTPGEPAELDALVALAEREHRAGRLAEAAVAYRKILAVRSDVAEMHNNLGNVLLDQHKVDEAAIEYELAVVLKPGLFQAHNNLAHLLWKEGKLVQAATRFQQAIALRPDCAEAHNNLGCIFQSQDKLHEAAAEFVQAVALKPTLLEAYSNLGTALKRLGKFDEATACYEQALALRPDFAEAHYYRTDLKTFRVGDPDLAALEALAAEAGHLPADQMTYVHFALGKALEDAGEYDRAFEHLLAGNALKRREVHYNETANQQVFQAVAERFDSSFLDCFAEVGDPSAVPIFIVGMPRSGSTLIEQILASHPQVHAAGELKSLDRIIEGSLDSAAGLAAFPRFIAGLDAKTLRRLGQDYLASLPALPVGKTRITDKTPFNFLHVGLIRLILPNARIIHTMRDPVDTCVSCFSRLFSYGAAFTFELAELGCYYRWYHELMDHWRSVLPAGAMLDVSYENVVDNLEEQTRRLIDYCGLPWNDRCLSFHKTSRPIATPSNVQVRQPLYRSSVARWRRYEAFLEPLLIELASCR